MILESKIEALRTQLQQCREELCEVTNVRSYDLLKAQISFLKDVLLKYYGVNEDV